MKFRLRFQAKTDNNHRVAVVSFFNTHVHFLSSDLFSCDKTVFKMWLKTFLVGRENPVLWLAEASVYKMETDSAGEDVNNFNFRWYEEQMTLWDLADKS